jgi:hypothetical protein
MPEQKYFKQIDQIAQILKPDGYVEIITEKPLQITAIDA